MIKTIPGITFVQIPEQEYHVGRTYFVAYHKPTNAFCIKRHKRLVSIETFLAACRAEGEPNTETSIAVFAAATKKGDWTFWTIVSEKSLHDLEQKMEAYGMIRIRSRKFTETVKSTTDLVVALIHRPTGFTKYIVNKKPKSLHSHVASLRNSLVSQESSAQGRSVRLRLNQNYKTIHECVLRSGVSDFELKPFDIAAIEGYDVKDTVRIIKELNREALASARVPGSTTA